MATGLMTLTLEPAAWAFGQPEEGDEKRHVQVSTNCSFYKISDYEHTTVITGSKNGITVKETPEEILVLIREAEKLEKLVREN